MDLTALEYRLLLTLIHNAGQVMTRNQLLENIWDVAGNFVNDNTLTVYMKRLRDKLEEDPSNPKLIQTVRGMGYRMGKPMIRNGEFGRFMLVASGAALAISVCITWISWPAALCTLAGFALLLAAFAAFTHARYRQIAQLSQYLKAVAAGERGLELRDNREGELSILKNDIYKLALKLTEQSELLKKDKHYLADALSDISHQLKTPLTSMFVMVDLLSDPQLDEGKRIEFTERMTQQLERIQWLMNALLKLSRIDAGAVDFRSELVRVEELVDKAVTPLEIPMELKQITLTRSGEREASFLGDMAWSTEAVVNILKNCMEHTQPGGRIEIRYAENPLHTELVIRDTGSGILREDLPHIFERFYRGRDAQTDSVGIGLAMAKTIVQHQNGDILVESQWGKGTAFTLKFYKRIV